MSRFLALWALTLVFLAYLNLEDMTKPKVPIEPERAHRAKIAAKLYARLRNPTRKRSAPLRPNRPRLRPFPTSPHHRLAYARAHARATLNARRARKEEEDAKGNPGDRECDQIGWEEGELSLKDWNYIIPESGLRLKAPDVGAGLLFIVFMGMMALLGLAGSITTIVVLAGFPPRYQVFVEGLGQTQLIFVEGTTTALELFEELCQRKVITYDASVMFTAGGRTLPLNDGDLVYGYHTLHARLKVPGGGRGNKKKKRSQPGRRHKKKSQSRNSEGHEMTDQPVASSSATRDQLESKTDIGTMSDNSPSSSSTVTASDGEEEEGLEKAPEDDGVDMETFLDWDRQTMAKRELSMRSSRGEPKRAKDVHVHESPANKRQLSSMSSASRPESKKKSRKHTTDQASAVLKPSPAVVPVGGAQNHDKLEQQESSGFSSQENNLSGSPPTKPVASADVSSMLLLRSGPSTGTTSLWRRRQRSMAKKEETEQIQAARDDDIRAAAAAREVRATKRRGIEATEEVGVLESEDKSANSVHSWWLSYQNEHAVNTLRLELMAKGVNDYYNTNNQTESIRMRRKQSSKNVQQIVLTVTLNKDHPRSQEKPKQTTVQRQIGARWQAVDDLNAHEDERKRQLYLILSAHHLRYLELHNQLPDPNAWQDLLQEVWEHLLLLSWFAQLMEWRQANPKEMPAALSASLQELRKIAIVVDCVGYNDYYRFRFHFSNLHAKKTALAIYADLNHVIEEPADLSAPSVDVSLPVFIAPHLLSKFYHLISCFSRAIADHGLWDVQERPILQEDDLGFLTVVRDRVAPSAIRDRHKDLFTYRSPEENGKSTRTYHCAIDKSTGKEVLKLRSKEILEQAIDVGNRVWASTGDGLQARRALHAHAEASIAFHLESWCAFGEHWVTDPHELNVRDGKTFCEDHAPQWPTQAGVTGRLVAEDYPEDVDAPPKLKQRRLYPTDPVALRTIFHQACKEGAALWEANTFAEFRSQFFNEHREILKDEENVYSVQDGYLEPLNKRRLFLTNVDEKPETVAASPDCLVIDMPWQLEDGTWTTFKHGLPKNIVYTSWPMNALRFTSPSVFLSLPKVLIAVRIAELNSSGPVPAAIQSLRNSACQVTAGLYQANHYAKLRSQARSRTPIQVLLDAKCYDAAVQDFYLAPDEYPEPGSEADLLRRYPYLKAFVDDANEAYTALGEIPVPESTRCSFAGVRNVSPPAAQDLESIQSTLKDMLKKGVIGKVTWIYSRDRKWRLPLPISEWEYNRLGYQWEAEHVIVFIVWKLKIWKGCNKNYREDPALCFVTLLLVFVTLAAPKDKHSKDHFLPDPLTGLPVRFLSSVPLLNGGLGHRQQRTPMRTGWQCRRPSTWADFNVKKQNIMFRTWPIRMLLAYQISCRFGNTIKVFIEDLLDWTEWALNEHCVVALKPNEQTKVLDFIKRARALPTFDALKEVKSLGIF